MSSRCRSLLFLALGLVAFAAHAWWNEDWAHRKTITLDTGPGGVAITTPVADLPVPVRLHMGNFPHFLSSARNGADLRFLAADDTTPLKFHIERWDPINAMALVWVKVPSIAPGATTRFHLYFHNPAAVAAQEPALTVDADMGLVYRFAEPAGPPLDITANANHAIASTALPVPASLIAGGVRFDGGQVITIADNPTLAQAAETGFTFSAWVKAGGAVAAAHAPAADPVAAPAAPAPPAPAGDGMVFDRVSATGARVALVLEGGALKALVQPAGGAAVESPLSAPLAAGTWQHLALVVGPTRTAVHVDGVEVTGIDTPAFAHSGDIHVGASSRGDAFFTGELDELQFARVARSADYLRLAAAAQGEASTLVVVGADETGAGGAQATAFTAILAALFAEDAVIGLVVIGLCGLMLLIATAVMVGKAVFLSLAATENARFLGAFERIGVAEPLATLYEKRDRFGRSPLFRVYRVGIDEARKRIHPSLGAAGSAIDGKGFAAIKAALDCAMVREAQRLNAYMLLLTIAISGGPYLGLLGTVVGVIITFGTIAATGDVNIATIAPGMAAALLTTVAGLAVAIPSLFGYNYLVGTIKGITADMYVFADALLTRINEAHGA
jgi:biopolymer transport protein ExbB